MIRAVFFDIEGCLVADKRYLPTEGAVAFVRWLRERSLPVRLITNNTTDRPPEILAKLKAGGFDFAADEVHTCISAAVRVLRERSAAKVFVIGSDKVRGQLAEGGLEVRDDSEVDAVVVGLDTELTYDKLRTATGAILKRNALLVALHRNKVYPDAQGRVSPSVGPTVEALAYATDSEPVLIGKPGADYYRQVLETVDVPPEEIVVVSDDPFSDLAGAKRMGMKAAFVLVGKYPDASVLERVAGAERPDVTAANLGELPKSGLFEGC
ncbi:MAG: HAD-IIA family hydrolase [Planctomycetota bacterium]|jgi:4-nitrophenyl phosphatase